MSLVKKQDISFAEISNYLENHPDFFTEHPGLLRKLSIPQNPDLQHAGRNVSSFVEFQVVHLQKQLQLLEKENHSLIQRGESQCEFINDVHIFVMHLLQTRTMGELYLFLQRGLRKYYAADRTILFIFARPEMTTNETDLRFLDPSSGIRFMFTELFHRDKPLCNSLQEEHLEALFNRESRKLHSTVILPMSDGERQSLMVLGSYEKNRYGHGTDLDLLQFISHVINFKISVFIQ